MPDFLHALFAACQREESPAARIFFSSFRWHGQ